MKILHISAVKNWGGGENHLQALCEETKKESPGIQNLILCVHNGKFHERLKSSGINFITAPLAIKMDLRFVFKLVASCKKEKIDLIHIHDPSALALTIIADKFYRLPPFVFSKKTSFPIKDRKQTLYKYNYPKIKKIFCVSEETKNIASKGVTGHDKLVTLYHGVNLTQQKRSSSFSLRKQLNIGEEKILVGNIGNHIRAKHLETFIEVVNDIINVKGRNDFFFVQMGDFTDRTEALKKKITDLNLQEHVAFLGFVPDASNLIPQFDMTLVTSQSEGLPGVIFESFYHRTPVVSTNVGGIPEIITDGENGLLANVHDHEQLSRHLLFLSSNPALKKQFTDVSERRLHEKFTSKIMARQTLYEYEKIINGQS